MIFVHANFFLRIAASSARSRCFGRGVWRRRRRKRRTWRVVSMARGLDGAPLAATWLEDASGHAVSPEGYAAPDSHPVRSININKILIYDYERLGLLLLLANAALVNERYGERHVDAVDAFFRLLQENCPGRSEMQVLQVKIAPEIELLFLWMPSCQKRATNASNCLAHFHHGRSATHWCQQCLQDKSCKDLWPFDERFRTVRVCRFLCAEHQHDIL